MTEVTKRQETSKANPFREALVQIRGRAFRLSTITCPDTCGEWEHPLCWIARTADAALRHSSETPDELSRLRTEVTTLKGVCSLWGLNPDPAHESNAVRAELKDAETYPCACPEGSCGRLMKYPNQYCRSQKANSGDSLPEKE